MKKKIIIAVDEELVCKGFERNFTEEERNILIRAIGNGTPYEEKPQGKWVYHKAKGYFLPYIECSVCHTENMLDGVSLGKYKLINKFCYNCGADMKGDNK